MGFGNGFPLFNYYGVLPYYLGAVFSFIFSYINSAKILFFIPLILGGVSMYFLGKELFGKNAGLISGVLFLFAPYRALDLYIRGAVAESFAISLIPLVFYFSLKLIRHKKSFDFIGLSLSLLFFLTSHNIMTLLFVPFLFAYLVVILFLERWKNCKILILSIIVGFGMAGFFLIPAYFEKGLIQANNLTLGAFDFRSNFTSIGRLFIEGNSSFQIGWPHWWLVILSIILIIIGTIKSGKHVEIKKYLLPVFLVTIFGLSVFMIHNKSTFIWEKIQILSYVQFPWRFLSVVIFSASLLGGYFVSSLRFKYSNIIIFIIILLTTLFNWSYFRPSELNTSVTDNTKLSGASWLIQQAGSVLDYLPVGATEPREPSPNLPLVMTGETQISNYVIRSNSFEFTADVYSNSKIDIPIFNFPNWQVSANDKILNLNLGDIGRIEINLPPGNFVVQGKFNNTPIRTFGNTVSSISLVCLVIYLINEKLRKNNI